VKIKGRRQDKALFEYFNKRGRGNSAVIIGAALAQCS